MKLSASIFSFVFVFILVSALITNFIICYTNEVYWKGVTSNQYFYEFFPSISATVGDYTPQQVIWYIAMASISGPKFMMAFCYYIYISESSPGLSPKLQFISGILR